MGQKHVGKVCRGMRGRGDMRIEAARDARGGLALGDVSKRARGQFLRGHLGICLCKVRGEYQCAPTKNEHGGRCSVNRAGAVRKVGRNLREWGAVCCEMHVWLAGRGQGVHLEAGKQ